jgi:hypothetical protein
LIERQFKDDLADPEKCGQKEPKIAVLLWVMQNNEVEEKKIGLFKRFIGLFTKSKLMQ